MHLGLHYARERAITDSQLACNQAHRFATALDLLHRLLFELLGVRLLLLGHTSLLW